MLLIALLALASPANDGKISGMDDWTATRIVSIGSSSSDDGSNYIVIQAGDLDGDGLPDDAYLKLACLDGKLTQAWYQVKGPRDSATGMASGKRQHKPVTFVKEWDPASPQLSAMKPTYDVKAMKGARTAGMDDWSPIVLGNTDGLCAAAGTASKTIIKSKSNITNN